MTHVGEPSGELVEHLNYVPNSPITAYEPDENVIEFMRNFERDVTEGEEYIYQVEQG